MRFSSSTSIISKLEYKAEVTFGCPSKSCVGAGICNIWNSNNIDQIQSCPSVSVSIQRLTSECLLFRFRKQFFPVEIIKRQFFTGTFPVEESYFLPDFLLQHFGLTKGTSILPSTYPIKEDQFFYCIHISITAPSIE